LLPLLTYQLIITLLCEVYSPKSFAKTCTDKSVKTALYTRTKIQKKRGK